MRSLLLAFLVVLLFAACNEDAVPREVIAEDQMQSLLTDIHLAEAWSNEIAKDSSGRVLPRNQDSVAAMYRRIYTSHGVTDSQYRMSMDWYRAHPLILDSIYTRMVRHLTDLETGKVGM